VYIINFLWYLLSLMMAFVFGPRNTWGNTCGKLPPNFSIKTGRQRQDTVVRDWRKKTGEDMDRKRAEEPCECPLGQFTFRETPEY
jgi:hypothetical protein